MTASKVISRLPELFSRNGFCLSASQLSQFEVYYREVLAWNAKADLISKNDECRIPERHFLESARLALLGGFDDDGPVLDLGTGGGFPGVPLKIVRPQLRMVLLDSRRRKGLFLRRLVQRLQLQDVEVVCDRAESLAQSEKYQTGFKTIVSRAVAKLDKLYQLSRPFLKSGGKLVTIKGSNLDKELAEFHARYPNSRLQIQPLPGLIEEGQARLSVVTIEQD